MRDPEVCSASLSTALKSQGLAPADIKRFCQKLKFAKNVAMKMPIRWVEDDLCALRGFLARSCRKTISAGGAYRAHLERHPEPALVPPFAAVVREVKKKITKMDAQDRRKGFSAKERNIPKDRVPVRNLSLSDLIMPVAYEGCRIQKPTGPGLL